MRRILDRLQDRWGLVAAAVGVLLVLSTPLLGRADVSGSYRPDLPPDALTNGCYPLPGGVVPDFPYVVRRDSDMLTADGLRRRLLLQVDRIDAAEAETRLLAQLERAGVADDVRVAARDFPGVPEDAVIRGEMLLDLPVTAPRSDAATCRDPYSTKRFTPDLPDQS